MHKGFFSDIITRKLPLFKAILAFNGRRVAPESPPLPEALSAIPGLDAAALWNTKALQRCYGIQEESSHDGAQTQFFWDFAEEVRRLALLDAATLQKFAFLYGVAAHAPEIALVIAQKDVLELREGLGERLYYYALQRGQYQLGEIGQYFRKQNQNMDLLSRIHLHGVQALECCCANWPVPLRQCAAPALAQALPSLTAFLPPQARPNAVQPVTELPPMPPSLRRSLWFSLKKILLKEVAPQWVPCFD